MVGYIMTRDSSTSMNLAKLAITRMEQDGLLETINSGCGLIYRNTIRKALPERGYVVRNGVETGNKKMFDGVVPDNWGEKVNKPNYEGALVELHKRHTEQNDHVVIIGGGYGVTAITAADQVTDSGKVEVFESNPNHIANLSDTVSRYDKQSYCTIHNTLVGPAAHTFGEIEKASKIDPSSLPDCWGTISVQN